MRNDHCGLFGDWTHIQANMFWYRFGKLTNRKNRLPTQIPLGWGWVFLTDKDYLRGIKCPPEQSQNVPSRSVSIRKRVEFWKRYLDPVILAPATLLCHFLGLLHQPESTERSNQLPELLQKMLERGDRPIAFRSPSTGLIEYVNSAEIYRVFYRVNPSMKWRDDKPDVSCSQSQTSCSPAIKS